VCEKRALFLPELRQVKSISFGIRKIPLQALQIRLQPLQRALDWQRPAASNPVDVDDKTL
jgi:hypothetical protein